MRAAQAAALSLAVASLLVTGACYKPNIKPGGLQCAAPPDECPDNFRCDMSQIPHVCVSSGGGATGGSMGGSGGGIGGKGGKGGG
ncbi:MAG: hypothetical protein ABUS79_21325, partial [Pseudomonadota bacterium]